MSLTTPKRQKNNHDLYSLNNGHKAVRSIPLVMSSVDTQ